LKVGDNVYCKRKYLIVSELKIDYNLTIGKCYTITEVIDDNIIYIIDDDGDPSTFWLKEHLYNVNEWFYSKKEIRKLKLDEIESEGRR